MFPSLRRTLTVLGLLALVLPGAADAQLREILAKSVSASSAGASLELELSGDTGVEVAFEDGEVLVDGDVVGSYESGDELDRAWRALLGEAMALEDGALAERLVSWSAPADLSASQFQAATEIDAALEASLQAPELQVRDDSDDVSLSIGDESSLVRLLVNSMGRLGVLEQALSGLDEEGFRVHVDEDVTILEGSVVDATVVVIEGTLRVEGTVNGDVVVVGGALDVQESGHIEGEVRIADARIVGNEGEIRDGIVDVLEQDRDFEAELRTRLRDEIREEIRSDLRNEIRSAVRFEDDEDSFSITAPFRPVIRGVGGVMEKLITVFVLALLGAGFLAFAGENMETITETARRSPGRAAMVGFAGSFLLIPVWLLGAVALAVSIIGIPVAIAWLPLFPLAAVLAALLGYVAVASIAGEWLADSGYPWTGWIRKTNPIYTLVGGLLGLSLAFIAANVISMAPFLGVLSGLLFAVGVIVSVVAMQIGFGAVILTRGGRRKEYYGGYDADAAWEAAMSVDVEEGLGDNPMGGEDEHA